VRRLKIINGVNIPAADNHGRAFPFNQSEQQYLGPALVGGKLYRMMVWLNVSKDGRSYVRVTFEEPIDGE
jgi:hypothetical protein